MLRRLLSWTKRKAGEVWQKIKLVNDTPHRIALGFFCGCLASFTPFFGFHFILGFVLAFVLRGNLIASALGTAVGNPLTFPIIGIGATLLGQRILERFEGFQGPKAEGFVYDVIVPYCVGGMVMGLPISIVLYYVTKRGVQFFQQGQRETEPTKD